MSTFDALDDAARALLLRARITPGQLAALRVLRDRAEPGYISRHTRADNGDVDARVIHPLEKLELIRVSMPGRRVHITAIGEAVVAAPATTGASR